MRRLRWLPVYMNIRSSSRYELPKKLLRGGWLTSMQFPFNNSCSNQNSMMTNLSMVGLRVEVARDTYAHVKKTLPPSLNTFPGEAEIKYYVKTTVVRPQFYKENIRSVSHPAQGFIIQLLSITDCRI
jgi:hypothetical protein